MLKAIIWQIVVENAAPAVPPSINVFGFIGTKMVFKINFTITPIPNAIAGINVFPIPCSTLLIVCSNTINMIDVALTCRINMPDT